MNLEESEAALRKKIEELLDALVDDGLAIPDGWIADDDSPEDDAPKSTEDEWRKISQ